jgi:hypothetical protein
VAASSSDIHADDEPGDRATPLSGTQLFVSALSVMTSHNADTSRGPRGVHWLEPALAGLDPRASDSSTKGAPERGPPAVHTSRGCALKQAATELRLPAARQATSSGATSYQVRPHHRPISCDQRSATRAGNSRGHAPGSSVNRGAAATHERIGAAAAGSASYDDWTRGVAGVESPTERRRCWCLRCARRVRSAARRCRRTPMAP